MSCLSQHDSSCKKLILWQGFPSRTFRATNPWKMRVKRCFCCCCFLGVFSFPFVCVCVRSSEYCSVWHSRVNSLTGDETTPLLVVILLLIMSSLSVARAREARQCYLLKANRTLASWVFAFFFFVSHCVINYSALLIHSFTLEICFLWVFVCVFVCFSQPHSSKDYFLGLEIEAEAKLP